MNKNQSATLNSFDNTDLTLGKFVLAWEGNLKFKSIVEDKFRPVIVDIRKYKQIQEVDIKGIRENKLAKQQSMADKSFAIANAVQALGSELGDNDLYRKGNYTTRDLMKGREENCVDKARIIEQAARDHAAQLVPYGVTESMLDAFLSSIDAFETSIPEPDNAMLAKQDATTQLKTLFTNGRTIVMRFIKKAAAQFKSSAPQFYNELMLSFNIKGLPTHHTDMDFIIKEKGTGNALAGVKVTASPVKNPEEKINQYSNMEGEADYNEISPEMYNVSFEFPDHETVKTIVEAKRGKKTEKSIEMIKIIG